jgi:putative ABC transport system permease protein
VPAQIKDIDSDQPVYDIRTMDDVFDQSTFQRWLNMTLVTVFAAISLVLASVGVYGVVAYSVAGRRREFGIRLALGAARSAIGRLVLKEGAALALSGAVLGLVGAVVVSNSLESLLYGVRSSDPSTFAIATIALVGVALLASYAPARRAASVDPAIALRHE